MGKWPSEIKKINIKWNSRWNGSNSLVSDHFDCFYYDLDHERCIMTPCSKSEFWLCPDRKYSSGSKWVSYRHCFCSEINPMGLINYIRNMPKKPSTQTYREVLSFCYAVTDNSDSKVVIDFFWKFLLSNWLFVFAKGFTWTRHIYVVSNTFLIILVVPNNAEHAQFWSQFQGFQYTSLYTSLYKIYFYYLLFQLLMVQLQWGSWQFCLLTSCNSWSFLILYHILLYLVVFPFL